MIVPLGGKETTINLQDKLLFSGCSSAFLKSAPVLRFSKFSQRVNLSMSLRTTKATWVDLGLHCSLWVKLGKG
jgi:hypothetical protein